MSKLMSLNIANFDTSKTASTTSFSFFTSSKNASYSIVWTFFTLHFTSAAENDELEGTWSIYLIIQLVTESSDGAKVVASSHLVFRFSFF